MMPIRVLTDPQVTANGIGLGVSLRMALKTTSVRDD